MSVTGVVNLNDGLLGQNSTQQSPGLAQAKTSAHASAGQTSPSALPQDQFTPSALTESANSTAEAAGLFSAPKAAALPNLVSASGQSTTDTNRSTAVGAASNAAAAGQASGGAIAAAPNGLGSINSPNTSNNAAASDSTSTAATGAGSVAQQTQLQALNNALAAIGLSAADIREVDRVASLINDFSPVAFTSLAYQLEAQAQNPAQPSAAAQKTQAAVGRASATGTSVTLTAATPAAQQTAASSIESGSNGQGAQALATNASAHVAPKSLSAPA